MAVDDANITEVKTHDEKPRDQNFTLEPPQMDVKGIWQKCLIVQPQYAFLIVIRLIKNSNLLHKNGLFKKIATVSDITRKGTVDTVLL